MFKFDKLFKTGIEDTVNRQNLSHYFIREFKKQERDNFYTPDIFFPPLYRQLKKYREQIEANFEKKKESLKNYLEKAKKNELDFSDSYYAGFFDRKGIVYKDYKKEQNRVWFEENTNQLELLSIEDMFSNGIFKFNLSQIELIEDNLMKAEQELRNEPQQMQLEDFINENQEKALSLNLLDYATINNVLQMQKDKLKNAELESEYIEVKTFAEERIKELKRNLESHLRNNYGKVNYKNTVAPYLWDIRLLIEYRDLLNTGQLKAKKTPSDSIIKTLSDTGSLSNAIQFILREYSDKYALNLFYTEFSQKIEAEYCNVVLELTSTDILNFIKFYEERDMPLPIVNISESEYNMVKHFIKRIDGYDIMYNVGGCGGSDNTFKKVVYLNDAFLEYATTISFCYELSVSDEMCKFLKS